MSDPTPSPLLEAIARGIYVADFYPDATPQSWDRAPVGTCQHSRRMARAAIAALEREGFVIVPKEPTYEMLADADSAIPRFEVHPETGERMMGVDGAALAYAAMLSARPKVGETE